MRKIIFDYTLFVVLTAALQHLLREVKTDDLSIVETTLTDLLSTSRQWAEINTDNNAKQS